MKDNLTLLLLAALFTIATAAQAQQSPNPTDLPVSEQIVFTALGKGAQIYTCQQVSSTSQWVFQAPEAILIDAAGKTIATHGAGPVWTSQDGSTVKGEVVAKKPSPEAAAIPWLLLKSIATTGSGVMSKIEFISRSDTHGGNAPGTGCDISHLNSSIRVPYTAVYTFYSAKP